MENRDEEIQGLLETLQNGGMTATDVSDNEFVKSHGRYLIGSGSYHKPIVNERFFQFSFPERPGALGMFLETLPNDINGNFLD
jgi:threonine dehydratase